MRGFRWEARQGEELGVDQYRWRGNYKRGVCRKHEAEDCHGQRGDGQVGWDDREFLKEGP